VAERGIAVTLRQTTPVPLDVSFRCGPGEVLAIFGPSGSGKTTILRTIAGLHAPASARVEVGRELWTDTASGTFVPPHRRRAGFVFQEYALFPHLSAAGNVIAALSHRPGRERRDRALKLLAQVRLGDRADRRPRELSGGERQRVALARALAREPAVLLLDEPFAATDRLVRRELQDRIDELRRAVDMPVVFVTHDFEDVVRLATHLLLLERGQVLASGLLAELTSRPELSGLRQAVGLGSVFDAVVSRRLADRRLLELAFDDGALIIDDQGLRIGSAVRVRIPAREVILATSRPDGLSLHNLLAGTVTAVRAGDQHDHVVVQVAVGRLRLLAEVTHDAVARLGIAPGRGIVALVKSVSVEVIPRG
jgi:molybdate transport system ATP-binding protein